MRTNDLRIGTIVGLQYERGRQIDTAEVVYIGTTCFQLSNGLLYFRTGGRCIQGPFGGHFVSFLADKQTSIESN